MLQVLTNKHTERLKYVFDLVFKDILGIQYQVISSEREYTGKDPFINYSEHHIKNAFNIAPADILFESMFEPQEIEMSRWKEIPVFFMTKKKADIPFDPFALTFYLVTRYEEYLPFRKDRHDRFPATESLAFKEGFLDQPVVNLVWKEISMEIHSKWPSFSFPAGKYKFTPTVDIDLAYAHIGKGMSRTITGMAKYLLRRDFKHVRQRIDTLMGKAGDPYDNFDYQKQVFLRHNLKPVYFVLLADYGKFDRNLSFENQLFRKLIQKLNKEFMVGIHTSYASCHDPQRLGIEIGRLSDIRKGLVTLARQHFVRISFPKTYKNFLRNSISEDYSMGYPDTTGFRAGICTPFLFYDLEAEQATNLRVFPFFFMDTALIDRMKLTPEEAMEHVTGIAKKVREVGGHAIGIWHNYSLSETEQYQGWRRVFEELASRLK